MLKIGKNWGKIANYFLQCSTKIGTTASILLVITRQDYTFEKKLARRYAH